jgi:membrane associated rhomboid family serine protease
MALALIVVCVLAEALIWGGERGWFGPAGRWWRFLALHWGGFWPVLLAGAPPAWPGQPAAMFATYSVLHAGPSHMAGNVAVLGWLGWRLRGMIDGRMLLAAWLACAVAGAGLFAWASDGTQPMVGASAAIYGLVGLWLALDEPPRGARARRSVQGAAAWLADRARRVAPTLAVLIGLELIANLVLRIPLAWQAHLGGLLTGLALGVALALRRRTAQGG